MSPRADKGKAPIRGERTPLLHELNGSQTSASNSLVATAHCTDGRQSGGSAETRRRISPRRSWRDRLVIPLIIACSILFAMCLFLGLLLASFIPSEKEREDIADAVIFKGPENIQILNVTKSGVWVNVEGHLGIDMDKILGVDMSGKQVPDGQRGGGSVWWEDLRTSFGRTLVQTIGPMEVESIHGLEIWTTGSNPQSLLQAKLPNNIPIPLSTHVSSYVSAFSSDTSDKVEAIPPWLTALHIPLQVQLHAPTKLLSFAKKGWTEGCIDVELRVSRVIVRAKHRKGWRRVIKRTEKDIRVPMNVDVPAIRELIPSIADLPSYPSKALLSVSRSLTNMFAVPDIPGIPAGETNLSKLVRLERYTVETDQGLIGVSPTPQLRVSAIATAVNPFRNMNFTLPYRLGFGIYLPLLEDEMPSYRFDDSNVSPPMAKMAEVTTAPIRLFGQERVTVSITGYVVPDFVPTWVEQGKEELLENSPLSRFLINYLHGLDNPVVVQGLPFLPWNNTASEGGEIPPAWIMNALPSISLDVSFPGPSPTPKLIKSVTIENMRISESAGKLRASGLVVAQVEIPRELAKIQVEVQGVLPDVLVFDGFPPDDGDVDPDETPYPQRAFGRIDPDDYLPASSYASEEDERVLVVRAPIHDVPIQVLQGRDKIMSDFVSKIIFKGGARAGIKGRAGVKVFVAGMGTGVELRNIPVSGDLVVGKPRGGI